jgi:hypothetical protein
VLNEINCQLVRDAARRVQENTCGGVVLWFGSRHQGRQPFRDLPFSQQSTRFAPFPGSARSRARRHDMGNSWRGVSVMTWVTVLMVGVGQKGGCLGKPHHCLNNGKSLSPWRGRRRNPSVRCAVLFRSAAKPATNGCDESPPMVVAACATVHGGHTRPPKNKRCAGAMRRWRCDACILAGAQKSCVRCLAKSMGGALCRPCARLSAGSRKKVCCGHGGALGAGRACRIPG